MSKKESSINWKQFEKMKGEVINGSNKNVFKFEEKEQFFIGKYLGKETISGQNNDFESFDFETESGNIAFSGGMSFADSMRMIKPGAFIRVTFKGKKKTGAGHKVNIYVIEWLGGTPIDTKMKKQISEEIKAKVAKKGKKVDKKSAKKK